MAERGKLKANKFEQFLRSLSTKAPVRGIKTDLPSLLYGKFDYEKQTVKPHALISGIRKI